MTQPPGAIAASAIAAAKERLAQGDSVGALARYRETFAVLVSRGEHYDACTIAHMAGVAGEDIATKHDWNVLALREADAEPDRAVIAWFYPSLHNNLAYSYAQLGEDGEALHHLRLAWANVEALEPGPYAERVKAAIKKRLDELESKAT